MMSRPDVKLFLPSFLLLFVLILFACDSENKNLPTKPNILLIYADDLGYGDVGAYGSTEIQTPNIDRLADNGRLFLNGHSSSATCTPSRYALLTGNYPWRNRKIDVLQGTAPLIIDTNQLTLPKLLLDQGYRTGIVGKWHLGLGAGEVDWNERIGPGPNEVGFEYSYILPATQDRVPTVYLENGHVVGLDPDDPIEVNYKQNYPGEPTGLENRADLKMNWQHGHNNSIVNGIPRIGFMKGGKAARWVDEDMADTFLGKAKEFIYNRDEKPFFLYYALQQPHVPRTPHPRFVGSTKLGPRGDVIVEADWCIGEILKTLENEGVLENTIVIVTSDNGPVLNDGYYDFAVEKNGQHKPWGPLRGGKYSLFEAGTRVPFIVHYPKHIQPSKTEALISQVDILNSIAKMVGSDQRSDDGKEMSSLLLGQSSEGRSSMIIEAMGRIALKKDNWVLIPPHAGIEVLPNVNIEIGNSEDFMLFDVSKDVGQKRNLANENPDKLQEMIETFLHLTNHDDLPEREKMVSKLKN